MKVEEKHEKKNLFIQQKIMDQNKFFFVEIIKFVVCHLG